jgi:hypothetical protein
MMRTGTVTARLVVTIDPAVLRSACAVWAGVEALLGNSRWRGLLHDGEYEPVSGFDSIEHVEGGTPQELWERAPRTLNDLGVGLPFDDGTTVGDGTRTMEHNDFSLVFLDLRRRRGVFEYRICLEIDELIDPGETERDELIALIPSLNEDELAHHTRAFFVFEWDADFLVLRSVCVVPLGNQQMTAATFFDMSEEEREQLIGELDQP